MIERDACCADSGFGEGRAVAGEIACAGDLSAQRDQSVGDESDVRPADSAAGIAGQGGAGDVDIARSGRESAIQIHRPGVRDIGADAGDVRRVGERRAAAGEETGAGDDTAQVHVAAAARQSDGAARDGAVDIAGDADARDIQGIASAGQRALQLNQAGLVDRDAMRGDRTGICEIGSAAAEGAGRGDVRADDHVADARDQRQAVCPAGDNAVKRDLPARRCSVVR